MKSLNGHVRSLSERLWLRRNSYPGPDFINGILAALGHPKIAQSEYDNLRAEVLADEVLSEQYIRHIPRLREISPHKKIADWAERCTRATAQIDIFYLLFRILRPTVVVETGVASGSMTSFILAALNRNRHGELFSFDIPPVKGERTMDWTVTSTAEIGFLVPDSYRDRWTLTLGDSTYELPKRFAQQEIDCFFHDSDHTFQHMIFEYAFAEKHLRRSGWLVSDDISWNQAFRRYFDGRSQVFIRDGMPNIGVAVMDQPS
jgi:predicted O-methyltransferase YrrM